MTKNDTKYTYTWVRPIDEFNDCGDKVGTDNELAWSEDVYDTLEEAREGAEACEENSITLWTTVETAERTYPWKK